MIRFDEVHKIRGSA